MIATHAASFTSHVESAAAKALTFAAIVGTFAATVRA